MNLKVYVQWITIFQRPAFMFNLQLRRGGGEFIFHFYTSPPQRYSDLNLGLNLRPQR